MVDHGQLKVAYAQLNRQHILVKLFQFKTTVFHAFNLLITCFCRFHILMQVTTYFLGNQNFFTYSSLCLSANNQAAFLMRASRATSFPLSISNLIAQTLLNTMPNGSA